MVNMWPHDQAKLHNDFKLYEYKLNLTDASFCVSRFQIFKLFGKKGKERLKQMCNIHRNWFITISGKLLKKIIIVLRKNF